MVPHHEIIPHNPSHPAKLDVSPVNRLTDKFISCEPLRFMGKIIPFTSTSFPAASFHLPRHVHQVLHQDVGGILGTAASGLQHAEAGMHEHHQGAAKAHPRRVQGTSQAIVSRLECRHLTSKRRLFRGGSRLRGSW